MTVNDTTTKNSLLSTFVTAVGANGTLTVRAGSTTLAVLTGVTWGTPASGSVSFTATQDASNDASGTADNVQLKTNGGTLIATFASGEITIGSVTSGGTTSLTSGAISI